MAGPEFELVATVLGCPDPRELARFYADLLGWTVTYEADDWVKVRPPDGEPGLSFQLEPAWVEPVWPPADGEQRMTMHLDIYVPDVGAGVTRAVELGARLAEHQPQDHVRVMLDPAGHPFCLFAS